MKEAVAKTHGPNVLGGVGGFAGLFDLSFAKDYARPLLATSTDGVGTKIAIAQALDKHDTIGQDLVGMVVDDIVVVGAKPLFMTDYIACGKVVPERIATIVTGIARACAETGTALVGGETAEHPGLMGADDYDLAGAAVGVVEADRLLGAERVESGDAVIAIGSSGLHSNGFSLVRHILTGAGIGYTDASAELGSTWGEALLEPTRLYTGPLVQLLENESLAASVHSLSHVTGGGIAANLARVLPRGSWVELDRATWSPQPVFRVLSDLAGTSLESAEGTWNLGIGFFAVVEADAAASVIAELDVLGLSGWQAGTVTIGDRDLSGFEQGAKGVDGGAVRLVAGYAELNVMRAAVSIGLPATTDADDIRALVPRMERLGFAGLWLNDVPNGDSLAGLRIAAAATDSLRLATGVIPLDRRPAAGLDLDGLPVERTAIGIGSGGARHPLALVEDGIATLRRATEASIVVGALGPRMRRLAAERADGVLYNWLTPSAATRAVSELRSAAGGRAVRTVLYVRTIAEEGARAALEREADRYGSVPSYAANFERLGIRAIDATLDDAAGLPAFDVVDEIVLRAITPTGSLVELERFVEETARWRSSTP